MFALDKFLEHHVGQLVEKYLQNRTSEPLAIDPRAIATIAGIKGIEEREMIPEAMLLPRSDGFTVLLRSNFKDHPGTWRRQRFSIAHEVAHALFYEKRNGVPKALKEAPTGEKLESACNEAAGLILLPKDLLDAEIRRHQDFPRAEHLIDLADRFEVSLEMLLRRLRSLKFFEYHERTIISLRGPQYTIEYAPHPPCLKFLPNPRRGHEFSEWFKGANPESAPLGYPPGDYRVKRTRFGRLPARRVTVSSALALYEITLDTSNEGQAELDLQQPSS
jgi:hypothetical protein